MAMLKCKDCGEEFEITVGEYEWYKDRNLLPPKRCKECRIKRRTAMAEAINVAYTVPDDKPLKKGRKGKS